MNSLDRQQQRTLGLSLAISSGVAYFGASWIDQLVHNTTGLPLAQPIAAIIWLMATAIVTRSLMKDDTCRSRQQLAECHTRAVFSGGLIGLTALLWLAIGAELLAMTCTVSGFTIIITRVMWDHRSR